MKAYHMIAQKSTFVLSPSFISSTPECCCLSPPVPGVYLPPPSLLPGPDKRLLNPLISGRDLLKGQVLLPDLLAVDCLPKEKPGRVLQRHALPSLLVHYLYIFRRFNLIFRQIVFIIFMSMCKEKSFFINF